MSHYVRSNVTQNLVVLLLWLLIAQGCATGGPGNSTQEGEFFELRPMILNGIRPSNVPMGWLVVRTQEEWTDFWAQHSFRPAPEIDFEEYTLVAIFLGQKPNPGHSIKITRAGKEAGKVVVHAVQTEPDPSRLYPQVIVYPYDAVLIPKTDQEIEFRLELEAHDDF